MGVEAIALVGMAALQWVEGCASLMVERAWKGAGALWSASGVAVLHFLLEVVDLHVGLGEEEPEGRLYSRGSLEVAPGNSTAFPRACTPSRKPLLGRRGSVGAEAGVGVEERHKARSFRNSHSLGLTEPQGGKLIGILAGNNQEERMRDRDTWAFLQC